MSVVIIIKHFTFLLSFKASKIFDVPTTFEVIVLVGFLKLSITLDCAARWKIISGFTFLIHDFRICKLDIFFLKSYFKYFLTWATLKKLFFPSGFKAYPETFEPNWFKIIDYL